MNRIAAVAALVGGGVLALSSDSEASDNKLDAAMRTPNSITQTTFGTKYFAPSDSCLDARIEIRLVSGRAQLIVPEIGATEPGNVHLKVSREGMHVQFGKESCRIAVSVTPVRQ